MQLTTPWANIVLSDRVLSHLTISYLTTSDGKFFTSNSIPRGLVTTDKLDP